jgi:acyl-CoA oxidase
MPPTTPCGIPVTAIVFARLFVQGCDHGIKSFLVPLHDGYRMNPGISSKPLTLRGSSTPVIHALTSFRRVLLPSTALLGDIARAEDQSAAFFENIDRVIVGTLLMGRLAVIALSTSAAIASMYSRRRHVSDPVSGKPIPIISIPTQAAPVVTAVAQAHVLRAFGDAARKIFVDSRNQMESHFIAAVWKVTAARMSMASIQLHINRCGAQGLFEVNQMTTMLVRPAHICRYVGDA